MEREVREEPDRHQLAGERACGDAEDARLLTEEGDDGDGRDDAERARERAE